MTSAHFTTPKEIICKKRDGRALTKAEIECMVAGISDGNLSDSQIAAWGMAIYLRGMDIYEVIALTNALANSGKRLTWDDLDGPVVGKHSCGGVGDKVSSILVPLVAACGAYVPKLSGRGLGHTGGTVDRMESIPGYNTEVDFATFRKVVKEVGCACVGTTKEVAKADKRFYSIRDITGSVESVELITASILSKKFAEGIDYLVMDVTGGSGALMPNYASATQLAKSLATVANGAGLRCSCVLTDMNQVRGFNAGNAVEISEAIEFLTTNKREPRLLDVTLTLGAELLTHSTLANDTKTAKQQLMHALDSGQAAERFAKMVAALGGPSDLLEHPSKHLAQASIKHDVLAPDNGYLASINTRTMGIIVVNLGGGYQKLGDMIDHSVGLCNVASVGDKLTKGQPLLTIHANNQALALAAEQAVLEAITISDKPVKPLPAVVEIY